MKRYSPHDFVFRVVVALVLVVVGVIVIPLHGYASEQGQDIVFVFESSNKLKQSDPDTLRKPLAKAFVSLLDKNDRVGIVSFSDQGYPVRYLPDLSSDGDVEASYLAIDKWSERGAYSNVYGGLEAALKVLGRVQAEGRRQNVILLADSQFTSVNNETSGEIAERLIKNLLPRFVEKGISVHAISLSGQTGDSKTLDILANQSGGSFHALQPGQDLYDIVWSVYEATTLSHRLLSNQEGIKVPAGVKNLRLVYLTDNNGPGIRVSSADGPQILDPKFDNSFHKERNQNLHTAVIEHPPSGFLYVNEGRDSDRLIAFSQGEVVANDLDRTDSLVEPGSIIPAQANLPTLHTFNFRDADIIEVMKALSARDHVNVLLGKSVSGRVNVSLIDVTLDEGIRAIAASQGYVVMLDNGIYFVTGQEELEKMRQSVITKMQTFQIEYSDPALVETLVKKFLGPNGMTTLLKEQRLLLVEDNEENLRRIAEIITMADLPPEQIMLEVSILEVTLNESEKYGLDWKYLFNKSDGEGSIGLASNTSAGSDGAFFNFVNENIEVLLQVLQAEGRVKTLSAPKLLTLEGQEASIVIGELTGYKTTTTINQVSTENVEFIEAGVILKVMASVDKNQDIFMNVHPEVSTSTLINGLPAKLTNELTTQLVVPDGTTVLLGGLIKSSVSESESGIPILRRIPLLKRLFSSREMITTNTETLVIITPTVIGSLIDDLPMVPIAEPLAKRLEMYELSINDPAARVSSDLRN